MGDINRRTLIRRGAALGAAAAVGTGGAASAAAASESAGAAPGVPWNLFRSPVWNGEMLFALGAAPAGTSEVGEVMEVVRRVRDATGDPASPATDDMNVLVGAWNTLGSRLEGQARTALAAGLRVTARERFLRASLAHAQELFFVLGTSRPGREEGVFQACERNWLEAIALWDPQPIALRIEAAGQSLPAWLFRPDASGAARPTYIICNGSDGQNIEIVSGGLVAALARGYNVVVVEGPGQMSLLFEREVTFVPDWAPIISAIVEVLVARGDVDSRRIAATGISFLGMVLASAAARSPGLAAVVLQPGGFDYLDLWDDPRSVAAVRESQRLPAGARARVAAEVNAGIRAAWPTLPAVDRFTIRKRGEIFSRRFLRDARAGAPPSDYFQMLESTLPFSYRDDLTRITVPTMVTANQNDQFFKRQSRTAFESLRSLPGDRKRLLPLTIAMGAGLHDQPMGPQVAQALIFDWLDRMLGA